MASSRGNAGDSLSWLQPLQAEPHRFSLFAAMRLLEQVHADRPRLGESQRARDDAFRLAQPAHLAFAPSDVCGFGPGAAGLPVLESYSFGVFGPNGSLPLHITELAFERRKQHDDPTISDFINLFQHRLMSLMYRAWAAADPAANRDRPQDDHFRLYLGALMGLGPESARDRDAAPDLAKLGYAGLYAPQVRSAGALQTVLQDYFEVPVQMGEFLGGWLDIPPQAYFRLGQGGQAAELGRGATLGGSTWQCQQRFEIVLGPLHYSKFEQFLPGARALSELKALVRLYTNDEWSWRLCLLVEEREAPPLTLNEQGRLGLTSWLGQTRGTLSDVVMEGS